MFAVDCDGRSGGLPILWKSNVDFTLLQYSNHHIHGVVFVGVEGEHCHSRWHLTRLYGHSDTLRREKVWNLLRSLKCPNETPWLVLEDFNKILSWDEKWGALIDQNIR